MKQKVHEINIRFILYLVCGNIIISKKNAEV